MDSDVTIADPEDVFAYAGKLLTLVAAADLRRKETGQPQRIGVPPFPGSYVMDTPTDAEAARALAHWHGQKIVGPGSLTVASRAGTRTGWPTETDRYVETHWREYTSAAEWVAEQVAAAHAAGRREGLEEAAKIVRSLDIEIVDDWSHAYSEACGDAEDAIRART